MSKWMIDESLSMETFKKSMTGTSSKRLDLSKIAVTSTGHLVAIEEDQNPTVDEENDPADTTEALKK